jgi:hypothetical protein
VEKQLGKLDNPTIDLDLDKEATLGEPDDVNHTLSQTTHLPKAKNLRKKFVVEIWRL